MPPQVSKILYRKIGPGFVASKEDVYIGQVRRFAYMLFLGSTPAKMAARIGSVTWW